ncbi:MAG: DUF421 domain-containing protein [Fimbriimonadaceae bacterium]|nr:DUF421 domain-containing protein [Fimbriimonadaceae bacterium]
MSTMQDYQFDLVRIFWGDQPPLFLLEIVFRTVILFVFFIGLLRVVGQRGTGQFTLFEFAMIIVLGSAAGDPMFQPDVPLLHAMLVITLVVLMHQLISHINRRFRKVQKLTEGKLIKIVEHGELCHDGVQKTMLSMDEIYMELRKSGARFLDEIELAYFETDGTVSVLKKEKNKPSEPRTALWFEPKSGD